MIELTKTPILPNCQVPNDFFGITVNALLAIKLWKVDTWFVSVSEIYHVIQKLLNGENVGLSALGYI